MIRRGLLTVGLPLALVGGGCTSGDGGSATGDDAPASATTAGGFDDPFLAELAGTNRALADAFDRFFERLDTQYTDREAYIDALRGLGLHENFETVLAGADALTPPPDHEAPFRIWMSYLRNSVALAEEFEAGIEDGDVTAVTIPMARLNSQFEDVLIELTALSPDFCRALTVGLDEVEADPSTLRACVVADDLPGGDYGRQANLLARETTATVFPLISTGALGLMEDDEEVRYLAEIQPIVEDAFEQARGQLTDLDPPPDLEADHDAVLTYLRDIADIAGRITEAAEANDQAGLPALYDESGRPGLALTRALSEDGEEIFRPFVVPDA